MVKLKNATNGVLCVLAAVGLLLAVGCDSGTQSVPQTPQPKVQQSLTIGCFAKAIGYSPYYVARHFRWFEEHPALREYKVDHRQFDDRPTISQAIDKGELQLLLSADIPAIMCRAQGNDIRIVSLCGLVTLHVLVRSDLPIKVPSDLKGRTVAFQKGTSSHYGFFTCLGAAKLSDGDVVPAYMEPAPARDAFENDRIDAWIVWSPFFEQQVVSRKGKILPGTAYRYTVTASAAKKFLSEHEEQVKALIDVMEKGKAWMGENPDKARAIVAEATGQKPEVVEEAMKNCDYSASLNEDVISLIQSMADFIAKHGATRLDRSVDVRNDLIDLRFRKAPAATGK